MAEKFCSFCKFLMNRESFPDKVLSNGFLHHFHLLYKAEKPSVHLHFVSIFCVESISAVVEWTDVKLAQN